MRMRRFGWGALAALCALVALHASGCSKSGNGYDLAQLIRPPWPGPDPGFPADSPANALRLIEWSHNNRSLARYRELFADDYRFFCSPLDSAGADWRDTPWTREDELISAAHLFVGGSATEPPASIIRLALDRNFFVAPDPRSAAWDPTGRWRKSIRTSATLDVRLVDGTGIGLSGHASFSLVRGDSAVLPLELRARGFGPDSSRWYIQRWEDETAQWPSPERAGRAADDRRASPPPIAGPQPSQRTSWCELKVRYR